MTVTPCSRPRAGDAEATKLAGAALTSEPTSPCSPLPEGRVMGGSRFWALSGESSDEENGGSGNLVEEECLSPRSGPASVSLGDFLSPACQLVGVPRLVQQGATIEDLLRGAVVRVFSGRCYRGTLDLERRKHALSRLGRIWSSSLRWCPKGRWSPMCHRRRCQSLCRPRQRAQGRSLLRWVQGLR
jgi:hypothetical protein